MNTFIDFMLNALSGIFNIFVLIPIFIFQSNSLHSQLFSEWQWQHPLPTGNTLNSIDFVNNNTGLAAGAMGSIIKTVDKGMSWISLNSGSLKNIFNIKFLNAETGICVGKDGLILRTTDCGIEWTNVKSFTNLDLHDICITENKIFVCGLGGKVLMSQDEGISWTNINSQFSIPLFCINFLNANTGVCGGYNNILRTTNAGLNWEILKTGIVPSTQIIKIEYKTETKIYAIGNSQFGDFYFTNNGGNTWERNSLELPYLFGGSVDLVRGMNFIDTNIGCIVTDLGTVLKTSTGGKQWLRDTSHRSAFLKEGVFKNVTFKNEENFILCGNGGWVLEYSNLQNQWTVLTGDNINLYCSNITKSGTVFSGGENGTLLRKNFTGLNWQSTYIKNSHSLNSLFFINDFTGFVCSNKGDIFKTTDGGESWKEVFTNFKKVFQMNKIFFTDKYNGYIAGGNENNYTGLILKSTNSGNSWELVYNNFGAGVFRDIYFISSENGFAVGDYGNLTITTDGGRIWNSQSLIPYDLHSLDFTSKLKGIIVGKNGTVFRTTDGGVNWDYILPLQYKYLNSVKFIDDDFVIAVGNEGTTIYSSNAGIGWNKVNSITDNDLYSVNFDSKGIYAFGENGTIIYSELKTVKNNLSAGINTSTEKYYSTLSNYPNPFNPQTIINYELRNTNQVSIKIFDILGNEVENFVNKKQNPGRYKIQFNGSNLSSGIYYYTLSLNGKMIETKRMVLLK